MSGSQAARDGMTEAQLRELWAADFDSEPPSAITWEDYSKECGSYVHPWASVEYWAQTLDLEVNVDACPNPYGLKEVKGAWYVWLGDGPRGSDVVYDMIGEDAEEHDGYLVKGPFATEHEAETRAFALNWDGVKEYNEDFLCEITGFEHVLGRLGELYGIDVFVDDLPDDFVAEMQQQDGDVVRAWGASSLNHFILRGAWPVFRRIALKAVEIRREADDAFDPSTVLAALQDNPSLEHARSVMGVA